jgi:hypothetical protein
MRIHLVEIEMHSPEPDHGSDERIGRMSLEKRTGYSFNNRFFCSATVIGNNRYSMGGRFKWCDTEVFMFRREDECDALSV